MDVRSVRGWAGASRNASRFTFHVSRVRVLVLCGDYWHPARNAREGLGALEADGLTFDLIEDARDWSPERMGGYPVVVLTKSNNVSSQERAAWVTGEVETAFREY